MYVCMSVGRYVCRYLIKDVGRYPGMDACVVTDITFNMGGGCCMHNMRQSNSLAMWQFTGKQQDSIVKQ